jgi:hypothetical protein
VAWYRVYFLNSRHRIVDVDEYRSDSDDSALGQARALLARRGNFSAFELWQEARPVQLWPRYQAA